VKLCLVDEVPGGHHTAYLSGLASVALREGIETFVASPEPIPSVDDRHWMQVPVTRHRAVRAGRKTVRQVIAWCERQGVDIIADLYLDKTIWTWPRAADHIPRTVHVLHHTHHYRLDPEQPMSRRIVTALARHRLHSWVTQGDTLIVHTQQAFDTMEALFQHGTIRIAGYPIRKTSEASIADRPAGEFELLFVGQARREKGLPYLIEAMKWLPPHFTLTVVGSQNPTTRSAIEAQFDTSKVDWIDRFITDEELAGHMDRASLVVLPYEGGFGDRGGASGVLLESLGRGRPLVTTTALEAQLPDGYTGAIVVEPCDPRALAEGIMTAAEANEELEHVARTEGTRFVASNHSFESYLGALVDASLP